MIRLQTSRIVVLAAKFASLPIMQRQHVKMVNVEWVRVKKATTIVISILKMAAKWMGPVVVHPMLRKLVILGYHRPRMLVNVRKGAKYAI